VPPAFFSFKFIPFPFDNPATLHFEAHHNLNLMIMESTNEKTLFEVAEIQLTYKSKVKASLRPKISGSRDVYEVLKKYWDENKIEFVEQIQSSFAQQRQQSDRYL
jgi:hypothetical protein